MNIDPDSLVESLQGVILAQTATMAMMFKVLVHHDLIDPEAFLAHMRASDGGNRTADDILGGQAAALENWLKSINEPVEPFLTVIDGGKADI